MCCKFTHLLHPPSLTHPQITENTSREQPCPSGVIPEAFRGRLGQWAKTNPVYRFLYASLAICVPDFLSGCCCCLRPLFSRLTCNALMEGLTLWAEGELSRENAAHTRPLSPQQCYVMAPPHPHRPPGVWTPTQVPADRILAWSIARNYFHPTNSKLWTCYSTAHSMHVCVCV